MPHNTELAAITIGLFVVAMLFMVAIIVVLTIALFSDSEMDEDTRLQFNSWHRDNMDSWLCAFPINHKYRCKKQCFSCQEDEKCDGKIHRIKI